MPLDSSGTDEQLRADLRVGQAVTGEARDLGFLCREVIAGLDIALTHGRACGQQFPAGALRETLDAHRAEYLVCDVQFAARVHTAVRPSKPLSVQQVRAGKLGADPCSAQMVDGIAESALGIVPFAQQ